MTDGIRDLAARLKERVDAYAEAIENDVDPLRLAANLLAFNTSGWPERVYHDEAFVHWQRKLEEDPDNVEAQHHLAIAHLARAIDREAGAEPVEADPDWKEGVRLWSALWRNDAFWLRVAAGASEKGDLTAAEAAREALPRDLLKLLYAIALDKETQIHRKRAAIQVVREADFPSDLLEEVQEAVFKDWISSLSKHVWTSDQEKDLIHALERIEEFLRCDGDCPTALRQLAPLLSRLAAGYVARVNADGDPSSSSVEPLVQAAGRWHTYLVEMLGASAQIDLSTQGELQDWFFMCAQAYRISGDRRRAGEYADRAEGLGGGTPRGDIRDFRMRLVMDDIESQAEKGNFKSALVSLDRVSEQLPEQFQQFTPLFVRSQCRAATGDLSGAMSDLDGASSLATNAKERAAITELRETYRDLSRRLHG